MLLYLFCYVYFSYWQIYVLLIGGFSHFVIIIFYLAICVDTGDEWWCNGMGKFIFLICLQLNVLSSLHDVNVLFYFSAQVVLKCKLGLKKNPLVQNNTHKRTNHTPFFINLDGISITHPHKSDHGAPIQIRLTISNSSNNDTSYDIMLRILC